MGTSVVDLINSSARRREPTTGDIVALASGASSSSKRATTSRSKRTTTRSSSAKSSKAPRAKAPCKYGPRDADGYCPKKPSSGSSRANSRDRRRVTARTTNAATKQAVDVVTNPRATREQKVDAVAKVGEVTATEVVKKTVKQMVTPARIERTKAGVKRAVEIATPIAGVVGAAVLGGKATSSLQRSRVRKQAQAMLNDTIKRTPPGQRHQFTPEVRAQLLAQYEAHIRRQNEILFTK